MAELSQRQARDARDRLARVAKDYNYDDYTNMHIVTQVKNTGFKINGKFGGEFTVNSGLIIWGKTGRSSGGSLSVSSLKQLENALKKEFASIWRENGVEIEFGF